MRTQADKRVLRRAAPRVKRAAASKAQAGAMDGLVSLLRKQMGKPEDGTVCLMSEEQEVREFIPSGLTCMDRILGGGWPIGRISEIFGVEASGKTTLGQLAALSCQRLGGSVLYLDFENSAHHPYLNTLGIDLKRIVNARPSHIEKTWDLIWETLAYWRKMPEQGPYMVLWDSVAASIPKDEKDEDSSADAHIGLVARSMSKGCRRLFLEVATVRAHVMLLNQEREKIGGFSRMGENLVTPGGRALRYAATQRVRCAVRAQVKGQGNKGDPVALVIKSTTRKNRIAPPYQSAEWVIDFRKGPSDNATILYALRTAQKLKPHSRIGFRVAYVAPWSTEAFTLPEWDERMAQPDFAEGARAAYLRLLEQEPAGART